MADLVLLAADKTIETGVTNLLSRPHALGCRAFAARSFVHVGRDPGCYRRAAEFLSGLAGQYRHAIVIFDREGSGATKDRSDIEAEVEERLSASGWNERAACVVIDPEVENWVWTDSPHLAACLSWNEDIELRQWLAGRGFWPEEAVKPPRPKEALQAVLRLTGQPRSSAVYGELARRVSVARCTDPAFLKLRELIGRWFPAETRP
ncbi:MAG TPA: hypothetical protein VE974_08880 [Thermoanaerobaculia bacterium]|nr:hypothetical protein [Thermoanaerobaculia bacterium]